MLASSLDALDAGATVISANRRLVHGLHQAYAKHRRERGDTVWPTPPIFMLDDWMAARFGELQESGDTPRLLLNHTHELLLWEAIVSESAGERPLLDVEATASAAAQAWRLMHEWGLELTGSAWNQAEDTEQFQSWARRFVRRCRDQRWITTAELPEEIAAALARRQAPAPEAQFWVGFDLLAPATLDLRGALQSAGVSITDAATPPSAAPAQSYAAENGEDEIRAAARWSRQQVEAGVAPVAVVVPEMERQRARVERIFNEELHADRAPWDEAPRAFHISLGLPLAEYPPVAAAMQVLEAALSQARLDWLTASALLRTPFIAGGDREFIPRSRLEAWLRAHSRATLSLSEFAGLAERQACPELAQALRRLHAAAPGTERRAYIAWAADITALLEAAGWPGERALDSAEFQAVASWRRLLEELATLDQVHGPVDFSEACARLRAMALTHVFQPRQPAAPVQVMGWLEASGQSFAALWLLGLDDTRLPAQARTHPFLPWAWQRDRGLPHATPRLAMEFGQRTLERLCRSAAEVVLSWPRCDEEGRPLRPSPLLPPAAPLPIEGVNGAAAAQRRPAPMEVLPDAAPAATAAECHASARTFEDQSACPFRAFIHHRLHANAMQEIPPALSPQTRGHLLHRALANFWQAFAVAPGAQPSSLAQVSALGEGELAEHIGRAADAAVDDHWPLSARPALAAIERERLRAALREWLEEEKKRADFSVLHTEWQRDDVEFAGLRLRVRLDRVDELTTGGRVLLDYKSGEAPPLWEGERMEAPQLPLYAAIQDDPAAIAAVALAQLKPGERRFRGEARASHLLPQVAQPGAALLDDARIEGWRVALDRLGEQYRAGAAGILPLRPHTCEHCALPAVCRRHEIALADDEGDAEVGE